MMRIPRSSRGARSALSISTCLAFMAIWAVDASAAVITVTSTLDTVALDGVVTLREAINSAEANADANADVTATRTGGYGAEYLRSTLHKPFFPDLWAVRSEL